MSSRDTWDEDTKTDGRARRATPGRTDPNLLRDSLNSQVAIDEATDTETRIGMMMRQTVTNTNAIQALQVEVGALAREVRQHQKGINEDRPILADSSAKHASNRTAVLMSTLFAIYEAASPYLHEFWRQLHNR